MDSASRSVYPASTMMMASFQHPQDKSPPRKKKQGKLVVDDKKIVTGDTTTTVNNSISPRDITRTPDETETVSSVASFANPPLPTNDSSSERNDHKQQRQLLEEDQEQQPQGLIYVNRAKRAAALSQSQEEEDEVAASAEERRKLRLSYIKSAARAIDEEASSALTTTATSTTAASENMPTFPALSSSGGQTDQATPAQENQKPKQKQPQHRSPHQTSTAAPVSPPLQAGTSPLSPQHAPLQPTTSNARDVGTTVASAAAAVAIHQQQQRGVPHIYHDFANVPDSVGYVRKKTGGVTQPFPEKLHELLEKESTPDFSQNVHAIVGWLPHGRAFLVRKPKEFTRDIMPKYFRQTKLTSFQRQLNLYGFRRITQGTDAGAYYHELFLRGRPQLCLRMVRQKVKGTGHKQPADAQTEPNFYALPPTTGSVPNSPAVPPPIAPSSPRPASPPLAPAAAAVAAATARQLAEDEMSPGTRGVHGAASLLKGIAAGVAPSRLKSINPTAAVPFLGPPAETAYDGSNTRAVGSSPMTATAQSFSLLSYHQRQAEKEEKTAEAAEEERTTFSSSPPPRSSYSSLLWGGGAPAPSPALAPAQLQQQHRAPPASFLWPQAAPRLDPPATGERQEGTENAADQGERPHEQQ